MVSNATASLLVKKSMYIASSKKALFNAFRITCSSSTNRIVFNSMLLSSPRIVGGAAGW